MRFGLQVIFFCTASTLQGSSERPQDTELALQDLDSHHLLEAQEQTSLEKEPKSDPRTARYLKSKNSKDDEAITVMDHYFKRWKPSQHRGKGRHDGEGGHDHSYRFADRREHPIHEPKTITDLSTTQLLKKLGSIYDPKGGAMDVRMRNLKMSHGELNSQAKQWVDKSHEAIKAAHHVIAEAANDAQNEFLEDGLRLSGVIRENYQNETAKMTALSIDPSVYNKIHLEAKARREFTPHEQEQDSRFPMPPLAHSNPRALINKRVLCNGNYAGDNPDIVHDSYGVIVSYEEQRQLYRIRLKDWRGKGFMPQLRRSEFDLISGEEIDGVEAPEAVPPETELVRTESGNSTKADSAEDLPPNASK